ncbi:MAG: N-acetyltransferase family protein [Oligoflexales bacterium]
MKPSHIRPALPTDAHSVATVHHAAWLFAHGDHVGEVFAKTLDVKEDAARMLNGGFPNFPSGKGFTLLREDSKSEILGYIQGGPSRELDVDGEIYAIYVNPLLIGSGIGKSLWQAGTAEVLKTYQNFGVWVMAGNERARRFYEKQGGVLSPKEKSKNYEGRNVVLVSYLWLS